ncbi:TOMM precursor leader peptide-binding protein [Streptomyces sp. NPDC020719]|uniref:TOMM precursor leader peptide-binding protein n=1 Tax=Streptomyces sp. NPDC020719 TaxID=3154896 RepID=UPI0033D6C2E1
MPGTEARLKRAITVVGHSPDVVELRTGVWNTRSFTVTDESGKGKLFDVVCALDGTRSHRELARACGVSRATVEAVVDHLRSLDVIEWGPTSLVDAYIDQLTSLRVEQTDAGRPTRSVITGDGPLADTIAELVRDAQAGKVEQLNPGDRLAQVLASVDEAAVHDGLRLAELTEELAPLRGSYVMWAQDVVNPVRSRVFNRLAMELGIPWTHVAIDGPFLLVGPTVVPGSSPCYECFETRVAMNLRESDSYVRYKRALAAGSVKPGVPAQLSAVRSTIAGHSALEAINFLTTGSTFTIGKVLGIYMPTMEIAHQEVLRLPGCRACGSLRGRDDTSLYFDARSWIDG